MWEKKYPAILSFHEDILNIAGVQPVAHKEAAASSAKSKEKKDSNGFKVETKVSGLSVFTKRDSFINAFLHYLFNRLKVSS